MPWWKSTRANFNSDHVGTIWAVQEGSTWTIRVYWVEANRDDTLETGYATQADAEAAIAQLLPSVKQVASP